MDADYAKAQQQQRFLSSPLSPNSDSDGAGTGFNFHKNLINTFEGESSGRETTNSILGLGA